MRFNVPIIVKAVADRVVGEVDANVMDYLDKDFTDLGTQDSAVQKHLEWLLDYSVPKHTYDKLIENVIDHPEMQFCFNTVDRLIKDARSVVAVHEVELEQMNREYVRSVIR